MALSDDDRLRIDAAGKAREKHLAVLEGYRVKSGATLTTPKPALEVTKIVPELKTLSKVTVRLHPRFGDEPNPDESKLGGRFLWPADEPWPTDPPTGIPFVPVLQFRSEDAPPNFAFRPGTDLLQLLWCPRAELLPVIAWRKRDAVTGSLAPYPDTRSANMNFVPVPCRVFPERVPEYPCYAVLPEIVRKKIDGAKNAGRDRYDDLYSSADGTKIGGYPRGHDTGTPPVCSTCNWGMDYLLTIAGREWSVTNAIRWKPVEERAATEDVGYRTASGLAFDRVLLFVCRRCENWPIGFQTF
ncbi:MAG TPA: hypothetical protein VGJ05_09075 [Fimbriiglobus sp.]